MEGFERRAVAPAHPVAPYIGGKKVLASDIIARIDQIPHVAYVEPFIGMGGIFLRRRSAPKLEVINDLSSEVANLFRVLQCHYVAFLDMMKFQITSRREFERLARTDPTTLTDMQRAARFLYLQRLAYGGKVSGQNFGIFRDKPGNFDVTRLGPVLEAAHERLAGVVIENLCYSEIITRYDAPTTLFYFDPPYWGSEKDYGRGLFSRADFQRLAQMLTKISGTFLMSLNDCPGVRECFSAFAFEEFEVPYTIAGGDKAPDAKEVLIFPHGQVRRAAAPDLFAAE
ncbi:DNA methyltransferase [Terrihabitans soli]|uniref:site-specific DNA-methyltransferase (adenine-specific) n=1 Tax=Terrihabitans soli TaxID=708113 RepID=A0A6S6QG22_9HYPH|nr:DNA adenine methylase [Terrihabitans soli]BCJ90053.1 DNA methyltransferase [Terrihabitans soli]